MGDKVEAVKQSFTSGVPLDQAIRSALGLKGLTVQQFAAKHKLPYTSTTTAIRGISRVTPAQAEALAAELGGTRDEWTELLWIAWKPAHVDAKAARAASG